MHFQKVCDVFRSMVESLEKEIRLQNELIPKLEEQNAWLHEYRAFLQTELDRLGRREKYELAEELTKALGLNQKLTAQVNMDFTNSSIPSSMQAAGRKKIVNSRVPSWKRRGTQPGHK